MKKGIEKGSKKRTHRERKKRNQHKEGQAGINQEGDIQHETPENKTESIKENERTKE